jgi:hypothetical protein
MIVYSSLRRAFQRPPAFGFDWPRNFRRLIFYCFAAGTIRRAPEREQAAAALRCHED